MAQILELGPYREQKILERERAGPHAHMQPRILDKEIWTRDYSTLDGVVFGASLMREILEYYYPEDENWPYLVLALVDSIFNLERWGMEEVGSAAAALKDFTLSRMNASNKRDLTAVLLLADLIEKTPAYRRSLHS